MSHKKHIYRFAYRFLYSCGVITLMAGMLLSLTNQPAKAAGVSALFRTTATALPDEDGEVKLPDLRDLQPGTLRRALPPGLAQLPTLTEPTQEETGEPTAEVTDEPTVEPTLDETLEPTGEATLDPTDEATQEPTGEPTAGPPPALTGSVRFTISDTAVCMPGPGTFEATVEVSLSGGSAILQTAWRIAEPVDLRTPEAYTQHEVSDGDAVTISGDWPGVRPGDQVVEIHFGAILLDPVSLNPISDGAGVDYYWYPWVCPPPGGPTVAVGTETATLQPTDVEGTEVALTETAEATVGVTEVVSTETATPTDTATATATFTPTPTNTFTVTPSNTPTSTFTPTTTNTMTSTFTPTATRTPTATFTFTPTVTDTATATATNTPTQIPDTATPTPTNTPTLIVNVPATQIAPTIGAGEEILLTATVDVNVGGGGPVTSPGEVGQPLVGGQAPNLGEQGPVISEESAGGGVPVTGEQRQGLLQATAVLGVESTAEVLQAPQPFAAGEEQFIPATGADLAPHAVPLSGLPLAQKAATYLGLLMIGAAFILQGLSRKF